MLTVLFNAVLVILAVYALYKVVTVIGGRKSKQRVPSSYYTIPTPPRDNTPSTGTDHTNQDPVDDSGYADKPGHDPVKDTRPVGHTGEGQPAPPTPTDPAPVTEKPVP